MKDQLQVQNTVIFEHRDARGRLVRRYRRHNLITNAGRNWLCGVIGNAQAAPAQYIALTANADAPAAGDTTLTGEYADSGLARAQGTYAHTADTDNLTITHEFTASADSKTVSKAGLFNAAENGTLFSELAVAPAVTLMTGEKLNVIWTIDLGL